MSEMSSSEKGKTSSNSREVGSYTNTHESGKTYIGKGTKSRMELQVIKPKDTITQL